ncbi:MAG: GGDEF domain-containing protein, partial [Acidimicrobiales bacterium]|nr:GGDEF domain-containing protein [Acidimicrobiales bacterium]
YNDTYGHPAGDVLLREFALSLRSCVRASDFVARYGGEEFCLVLPDSSADGAVALIEQLRSRLSSPDNKVAFSAGVATREAGESAESLIERADNALYRAKGTGKDRTVVD